MNHAVEYFIFLPHIFLSENAMGLEGASVYFNPGSQFGPELKLADKKMCGRKIMRGGAHCPVPYGPRLTLDWRALFQTRAKLVSVRPAFQPIQNDK